MSAPEWPPRGGWQGGPPGGGSDQCPGGTLSVVTITITGTPVGPTGNQPSPPNPGPTSPISSPSSSETTINYSSSSEASQPSSLPGSTTMITMPSPSGTGTSSGSTTNANPPSPSGSSGSSPLSGGVPMIDTVNKWRRIQGHSELTWDNTLQSNAQSTVDMNQGGVIMQHSGPNAQVLVDGFSQWPTGEVHYMAGTQHDNGTTWEDLAVEFDNMTPFEWSYIQWLCEYPIVVGPGDYNGKDYCAMMALILNNAPWKPGDEHGHYDILTGNVQTIGCAYQQNAKTGGPDNFWPQNNGEWGCNLA
ncbi:MAG: hypothetical protein Q9227_004244 [Pyrenula ochraceoflavens]